MLHMTAAAPTYAAFVAHLARLPAAVCGSDTGALRALTHIVAADMGTREGCELVQEAVGRLTAASDETCPHVRILFLDASEEASAASEGASQGASEGGSEGGSEALSLLQVPHSLFLRRLCLRLCVRVCVCMCVRVCV